MAQSGVRVRGEVISELVRRTGLSTEQSQDAETGIYNWVLEYAGRARVMKSWRNDRFASMYAIKARSVIANLDPRAYVGNSRLLARLMEGEFAPHSVAWMKPENMHPERWQATLDLKTQQDHYVDNAKPASMTDAFKCKACGKRECTYTELQLRSSDEPASIFISCINCGKRWRQG